MYWICIVIAVSVVVVMGIKWICAYKADHLLDKHFQRNDLTEDTFIDSAKYLWLRYRKRRDNPCCHKIKNWSRRESDFLEAAKESWLEYNERRKKWLEKK